MFELLTGSAVFGKILSAVVSAIALYLANKGRQQMNSTIKRQRSERLAIHADDVTDEAIVQHGTKPWPVLVSLAAETLFNNHNEIKQRSTANRLILGAFRRKGIATLKLDPKKRVLKSTFNEMSVVKRPQKEIKIKSTKVSTRKRPRK